MTPRLPLLALLSSLAWLGAAQAADLVQVYRDAQANDPQYEAARSTLDAGREKLPQGRSGLLPTVSLGANVMANQANFMGTDRNYNSNGYTLSLTQPLFRWQNLIQYDQAKLQVAQAEMQFAKAGQDLILRVAQAYFDVLYAEENLKALEAQKVAIAQQLALAKKSFEVGTATITDTHEAQSRYDLATAQEIAAASDLEVKRHQLRAIIGKEAGSLAPLRSDARLLSPEPARLDNWVSAAEQNSLDVQIQQAGLDLADKEVERNRAGHYPSVDAVASYAKSHAGASQFGSSSVDITQGAVGVQMTLPIYQGGYVSSRVREANANREAARSQLENARRQSALGARQYYLGVSNGLAQVKALEAALVSSQSALDSNKLGYEVGVRINIDVLNAEQQLTTTRRDLAKARLDTLLAQLRLKAAVASLGEEDLLAVNALLDR